MNQKIFGRRSMYILVIVMILFQFLLDFLLQNNLTWLFATQRILSVQYSMPENIQISEECRHLISRIFVGDPAQVSEVLE